MENTAVGREFHLSRQALDRYQFDETLLSLSKNIIFADFHAARSFAERMNRKRDLVSFPEQTVKAGQINSMGLIDEILHYMVSQYREDKNPEFMEQALAWLQRELGEEAVEEALGKFVDEFPPTAVYKGKMDPETYLQADSDGVPNRQLALQEMLILWTANMNPAYSPFIELFEDKALETETPYLRIISSLHDFFDTQPSFGPEDDNLIDFLLKPANAAPDSLSGQLDYLQKKWGYTLEAYLTRLLRNLDLIREEESFADGGPGPALVYEYGGLESEPERYSRDLDWMPNLVLMAKNSYVWLDQLSKKYGRSIARLDDIPDEELEALARWGFSGLWLIGLWERSPASQKIKQLSGNPEAVASAYSLFDYRIADDLGGEGAFQNLKDRAWEHGIRMASDMVPNHMGIDSSWVIEHPEWFVSIDHSPFPSYNFSGPNLSWDQRVGIYLEDHYYSRSDAAVVFKRVDGWSGSEKYIYHGNDGTGMPWNDTAQLDYLNPEVREAVIQMILHVARKFPVIRFDAAMTLTKKHFQRLWFPEPGGGGDIPSRSDHGLSKPEFDSLMGAEFWREVVDRVAQEAPETLLLAEAFWLLEGYFVRTLGMHRVYNSAFMNMLKDEENDNYRSVIKNTLEFDPEILKRFVNFMSNPDEDTAVAQFGGDDKYFGACTIMATIPGLPMFAHGQIEGLGEKYGMEYRRAYHDEVADEDLIRRHQREIFPLLRRRYLFSGVENFTLYDFFSPQGGVNEDVFAYSNGSGDERALVIYHNKYASAQGWIRTSVPYAVKKPGGDERELVHKNLGESLGLKGEGDYYCIFRDHVTGLEYIRGNEELLEKGLYVELGAFKYNVFLDFCQIEDNQLRQYEHLASHLNGRGVPSIQEALKESVLKPVHDSFKELMDADMFRQIMDAGLTEPEDEQEKPTLALKGEVEGKILHLIGEIKTFTQTGGSGPSDDGVSTDRVSPSSDLALAQEIGNRLQAILQLTVLERHFPHPKSRKYKAAVRFLKTGLRDDVSIWAILLGWTFTHSLGKIIDQNDFEGRSRSWIDELMLDKIIVGFIENLGLDETSAWEAVEVIKILTTHQRWFKVDAAKNKRAYRVIETLLNDQEVGEFLGVNRHQDVLWFNKEAFDRMLWWMLLLAVVDSSSDPTGTQTEVAEEIIDRYDIVRKLEQGEEKSGYQVEKLLESTKTLRK